MQIIDWLTSKFYANPVDNQFLDPNYSFPPILNAFKTAWSFVPTVWSIFNIICFIAAVFSIYVLCYTTIRLFEIRKKEHAYLHHEIAEYAHHHAQIEKEQMEKTSNATGRRWDAILQHVYSQNSGDWKIAIMDADEMLEDLLDQLGFEGENLGEKLKKVDMEKYEGLRNAWDAHLMRNKIAHGGIEFVISQQEAKRVIEEYEQIFREFRYI